MMLWHVNLNIKENNLAIRMMWNRIAALWHESATASGNNSNNSNTSGNSSNSNSPRHNNIGIQYRTPFEEICCSIAYTLAGTPEGGIPASANIPLHLMEYENLNSGSVDSQNYHKKINSSYVVDNREYVAPTEDASAAESVKRSMWDIFSFSSKKSTGSGSGSGTNEDGSHVSPNGSGSGSTGSDIAILQDLSPEELKSLLLQQEANMKYTNTSSGSGSGTGSSMNLVAFGNIEEFLTHPPLSFANPRNSNDSTSSTDSNIDTNTVTDTDKQQMMSQLGVPLCSAIKHMCVGEYKEAAIILLRIQGLFGSSFGSSILHSNILETTLIEA